MACVLSIHGPAATVYCHFLIGLSLLLPPGAARNQTESKVWPHCISARTGGLSQRAQQGGPFDKCINWEIKTSGVQKTNLKHPGIPPSLFMVAQALEVPTRVCAAG